MTTFDLKDFLANLSSQPGIYQMIDAAGKTLYVGKAKNLKKRVSSYFSSKQHSAKTQVMLSKMVRIEVTLTPSENEALLLESNLIKSLKPRYNVLLRDDKSYPYLFISTEHDFPRLDLHRGVKREKGRYFGPYPSVGAVRETLNLLQKLFKIRQCRDSFFESRSRPCLQYQIKRCTAPCVGYIDKAVYREAIDHAILFLEGRNEAIIEDLTQKMQHASETRAYEQAKTYRDLITRLRQVQEDQIVTREGGDIDVMVVLLEQQVACVQVLSIQGGRVIGSKAFFPKIPKETQTPDILEAFIAQYYLTQDSVHQVPAELIVNRALPQQAWLAQSLSDMRGKRFTLSHQVRGKRADWLRFASMNAQAALNAQLSSRATLTHRFEALSQLLGLTALPQRVECFDVSHSLGEATVASCVVFDTEGARNSDYRRFNIKGLTPGDDYGALAQAITRRYQRLKKEDAALPEIIFIDGGKGQLSAAANALEECQVSGVLLVGIAKGPGRKPAYDRLFLAGEKAPLQVPSDSPALHLVQQIRDEAHRFAISGHRQQRDKKRTTSVLEGIPGVGAKRRQRLLAHFGGLQGLQKASVKEIAKVPGISEALAQVIHDNLH